METVEEAGEGVEAGESVESVEGVEGGGGGGGRGCRFNVEGLGPRSEDLSGQTTLLPGDDSLTSSFLLSL